MTIKKQSALDVFKKPHRQSENKSLIDLQKFCAEEGTRYSIEKPFSRGDYTYATNGHILIRILRDPAIDENSDAPDCDKLFREALSKTNYQWVKVPTIEIKTEKCGLCDGVGSYVDEVDNEKRECCDACDGSGVFETREAIRFPINGKEIGLSNIYVALIAELPNPTIGLIESAIVLRVTGHHIPVMFKFDGGDGLLMPMTLD